MSVNPEIVVISGAGTGKRGIMETLMWVAQWVGLIMLIALAAFGAITVVFAVFDELWTTAPSWDPDRGERKKAAASR